jgi:hypothetical protein
MTKSGPSRNPFFLKMHFEISRLQKKRKAQLGGEAASAAACAIGFYMSLDAQKRI